VARQAKETECQKCRKYYESVPVVKYVKECAPVYDEKCHTDYHQVALLSVQIFSP
jgi:hypothetical protein